MQHRLGLLTIWKLPWWKKEGYAEYLASDGGVKSEAPPAYREAAAWKYLLETRKLSFDEIIHADLDFDKLRAELEHEHPR